MTPERGDVLGQKLCAILGIDPAGVTRLVLDVPAGGLPVVYVRRVAWSEECRKIEALLQALEPPRIIDTEKGRG